MGECPGGRGDGRRTFLQGNTYMLCYMDKIGTQPSYADAVAGMEEFGQVATGLIAQLLRYNDVKFHTIDYRVKSEESATSKLADGTTYDGYSSLHDLLGLRVTCYFSDDVDTAADVLGIEFKCDPKKSSDRGDKLRPNEFGYRSVHRVAQLGPQRANLPEYARFKHIQFEIQLRTVVQHAWAEIEHDLGYKQETSPDITSRRFAMLAGVLELVDSEFMSLRDKLRDYETEADESAKTPESNTAVDQATIAAAVKHDPVFTSLDKQIVNATGGLLFELERDAEWIGDRVRQLHSLNLNNMTMVRKAIEKRRPYIVEFARRWMERIDDERSNEEGRRVGPPRFPPAVGLLYLWMVLKAEDIEKGVASAPDLDGDWVGITQVWAETCKSLDG